MYDVKILPSAWEDLKKIADWYSLEFSEKSAQKVTDRILDAIERLEQFSGFRFIDAGRMAE